MTIYTLFERYHYDTDLGQEFNIQVFKTLEEAVKEVKRIKKEFQEITGTIGKITEYFNPQKTYMSVDIYDKETDQWDIIEIEAKEVK